MKAGEMKVKLNTGVVKAELTGTIASCIVDSLRFVRDPTQRLKIIANMESMHMDMCNDEAERAAKRQQESQEKAK